MRTTSASTSAINYGKIKRDLFLRDTNGGDSRFTTKVGKCSKKYDRNKNKKDYGND